MPGGWIAEWAGWHLPPAVSNFATWQPGPYGPGGFQMATLGSDVVFRSVFTPGQDEAGR